MRTIRLLIISPLVFVLGLSTASFADDHHAADPAALMNAVTDHVAAQDADRTAVREALAQPEVKEVAGKTGIDLDRVTAVSQTLSGPDLQRAAAAARDVNRALAAAAGSSSVTLSTTTLILILLVVILIIVAVK